MTVTVFIFCFIILGKNVVDDYHCFSNLLDKYSNKIFMTCVCCFTIQSDFVPVFKYCYSGVEVYNLRIFWLKKNGALYHFFLYF
jgi:hypothetical protein